MGLGEIDPLQGIAPVAATNRTSIAANYATSASASSDSTTISPAGGLMSKLQQLSVTDPAKFKAIMTQAANDLRDAAAKATAQDSKGITDLAASFDRAASSGQASAVDLTAVTDARRAHHHHLSAAQLGQVVDPAAVHADTATSVSKVSQMVDQALGLSPPPFGPWFSPL